MRTVLLTLACLSILAGGFFPAPASAGKGKKAGKIKVQSITGYFKSIDIKKGVLVISQKLKTGDRSIEFKTTKKTKVFWSKTKMKVTLKDLNPGVKIIIQFYKKGKQLVATKVVLPGGMKEAADAILKGQVKSADKK